MFRNVEMYLRRLAPVFALFGYLTLIYMVTIGSIRYRFPLEPFLIIYAGYFLTDVIKKYQWFERIELKIKI